MPLSAAFKEGTMGGDVRIVILSENTAQGPEFSAEYGLSVWIEADGTNILFDTGSEGAFASNAGKLGIDLSRAGHLVLSHGHFDHTGGVALALDLSPEIQIHLHPDALHPKYLFGGPGQSLYIGMPEKSRQALEGKGGRCNYQTGVSRISEHVFLTGFVPRKTAFEKIVEPFTLDVEGNRPDTITDDQALWIETQAGLVVVLGCAHSGAVNTVEHIKEISGRNDIRAVMGGMHLMSADQITIQKTADAMISWNPDLISPNHCTGDAACAFFRQRFAGVYRPSAAGTTFLFE